MANQRLRPKVEPLNGEKARGTISTVASLIPPNRLDTQFGLETQRYTLVARNPVVKSALSLVENGTFWTNGSIQPNPNNDYDKNPTFSDLDDQIITLQNNQLELLGTSKNTPPNVKKSAHFIEVLKSILEDSRINGYSVSELVWDKGDGFHRLAKIKVKPPWNFNVYVDQFDEIDHLRHVDTPDNLEPERFVVGTWPKLKHGNYYGVSDMQAIEADVEEMEKLKISLIKGGAWSAYRPLVAHYALGVGEKELIVAKNIIENLGSGSTARLLMYSGEDGKQIHSHDFETLEDRASEHAIENLWNVILELTKEINRCLGVPDELGNVSTNVGSLAKAQTQFEVFVAKVTQSRQYIESIAQSIIDTICYYNFQNIPDGYHPPVWHFGSIEEDADKVRAEMLALLVDKRIIDPKEAWIRESFENIPPADPDFLADDPEIAPTDLEDEIDEPDPDIPDDLDNDPINELTMAAKSARKFNKYLSKILKKMGK